MEIIKSSENTFPSLLLTCDVLVLPSLILGIFLDKQISHPSHD